LKKTKNETEEITVFISSKPKINANQHKNSDIFNYFCNAFKD